MIASRNIAMRRNSATSSVTASTASEPVTCARRKPSSPTITVGRTQVIGSAHARRPRAIISRPPKATTPSVGS
jgi:hypothetical protein